LERICGKPSGLKKSIRLISIISNPCLANESSTGYSTGFCGIGI
jgi:hypothetical protein